MAVEFIHLVCEEVFHLFAICGDMDLPCHDWGQGEVEAGIQVAELPRVTSGGRREEVFIDLQTFV